LSRPRHGAGALGFVDIGLICHGNFQVNRKAGQSVDPPNLITFLIS
jgi:hypothetical protein